MEVTIKVEKVVNIKAVSIVAELRHIGDTEDDDVPSDFPLLEGNLWKATVDVETGIIEDWPEGEERYLHTKVCDAGAYCLLDEKGYIVSFLGGYVPNELIPGEFGDYIVMNIAGDGKIKEWPTEPSFVNFPGFEED